MMRRFGPLLIALGAAGALGACGQPATPAADKGASPTGAPAAPAMVPQAQLNADQAARVQQVNDAAFTPEALKAAEAAQKPAAAGAAQPTVPATPPAPGAAPAVPTGPQPDPLLLKAQVLLDRSPFSPGAIDGLKGENMRQAIAGLEEANGLPVDGKLDAEVWAILGKDSRPVLVSYTLTDADVRGPYATLPPESDYEAMAALPSLGYQSAVEALAERFHMDQKLLVGLNPGVDFTRAGVAIVVADPGAPDLQAKVARIEVDKSEKAVRAYDENDNLVALYPATIGSSDMPSPVGTWKVTAVQRDPVWNYDPAKLHFGKIKHKLTIPAGPNNPVGAVWIDLSKPTYGIHGTPEPEKIGKTQSHGCVRLTNWDALQLASGVENGAEVAFVTKPKKKPATKA